MLRLRGEMTRSEEEGCVWLVEIRAPSLCEYNSARHVYLHRHGFYKAHLHNLDQSVSSRYFRINPHLKCLFCLRIKEYALATSRFRFASTGVVLGFSRRSDGLLGEYGHIMGSRRARRLRLVGHSSRRRWGCSCHLLGNSPTDSDSVSAHGIVSRPYRSNGLWISGTPP